MSGARSALIVSTYAYDDPGLTQLRAPERDAEALAAVLGNPAIGGFEVETVLNQPAHTISRAVAGFFKDRRPDDLLLVHFSCHGIKDDSGELYLAASDTSLSLLEATGVSSSFVNRVMDRSRAGRILLMLDCCYAGAFSRGMTARAAGPVDVNERLGGRGRAVITASSALQFAFEGGALTDGGSEDGPSVFTGALVRGLESGDADRDLDGWVSLDDLYGYVHDEVTRVNPDQTPKKWTFDVEGDIHVARRATPVPGKVGLPVETTETASPVRELIAEPSPSGPPPDGPGRRWPWLGRPAGKWIASLVAVAAVVVTGFFILPSMRSGPTEPDLPDRELLVDFTDDNGIRRIVALDTISGQQRIVLDDPAAAQPTLSADRRWMAYLRHDGDRYVPHLARVDGSEDAPLLSAETEMVCPSTGRSTWSSDGSRLAMICTTSSEGGSSLIVVDYEGAIVEVLVENEALVGDPTWAGTDEIIYTTGSGEETRLWAIPAAGNADPVAFADRHGNSLTAPDWSHQGLLVLRRSETGSDVWLLADDRLTRLTTRGDVKAATWSPDGDAFVYLTTTGDDSLATIWRQVPGEVAVEVASGRFESPAWSDR